MRRQWAYQAVGNGIDIVDELGKRVARIELPSMGDCDYLPAKMKAKSIVRAVNNHEALLEAANGMNMWISNYVYAAGLDPNAVPEIQRLRTAINAAEEEVK